MLLVGDLTVGYIARAGEGWEVVVYHWYMYPGSPAAFEDTAVGNFSLIWEYVYLK